MPSVNTKGENINPFPGLRPFTSGENDFFFGRGSEIEEIAGKLLKNRFVAVTGASGSGKSSLINCGIVPEIKSQSSKWKNFRRILTIKPGNSPVRNIAEAFVESDLSADKKVVRLNKNLKLLKENPEGISIILNDLNSGAEGNTLLIIDQFEELFRYGTPETGIGFSNEAAEFIDLITNALIHNDTRFHAIISLRSDLISECAQFKSFTQLVNNSNFLVPTMTRENFREVITGPVRNAGAKIDDELVEVLLNDIADRTDQLPVLQHALMRTWNRWLELDEPDRPLGLSDYNSIGRMKDAISRHADEEYGKLDPEARKICEKLFKIITGKGSDNKGFRYPSNFKTLRGAVGCTDEELKEVIDRFRKPSISVITPAFNIALTEDSIIDLSHESLIRLWGRLRKWVQEEAESVQMYLNLSEASALYQQGRAGLLKPPDLQLAVKWRDQNNPTLWWAQKYNPAFERAMVYLRTSEKEFLESEEQKSKQQRWRLKRIRIISSILGVAVILTILSLAGVSLSKVRSDNKRKEAERLKEEMEVNKSLADQYAAIVVRQSIESDSAASAAENKELQERELREAAENRLRSVEKDADKAKQAGLMAETKASKALEQTNEARRNRMISVAKSMSLRSLQISGETNLQALLSYQAYLFNKANKGHQNDADIYAGLYNVAKQNGSSEYRTFSGFDGQVRNLAFIPGTREFFSSGSDGRVLRWNLDDKGQTFRVVYSDTEIIGVMAVSPKADWLACGGVNAGIKMIPVNGTGTPYELKGHTGSIRSLIFSYDGKSLYSAALDGRVIKWDLTARTSTDLSTDKMQITSIDLSSTGRYLAGLSNEGKVLVWNPDESQDRFRIESEGKVIRSIRFKPDEERVAVGYNDGTIELWNIATREKIADFKAHNGEVSNIRFNRKHSQMATAGSDGDLKIWDTGDLSVLPVSFSDNGGLVITYEFSPDGEVIISASVDDKPKIIGRPAYADAFAIDGCKYVTRNFTPGEWMAYVGKDIEYEKTCPEADFKIRIREVK